MGKKGIKVGSVTYAIKGRDLLIKNGYKAYLTRNPKPDSDEGCGYVIYVTEPNDRALKILKNGGVKVYGTVDLGDAL